MAKKKIKLLELTPRVFHEYRNATANNQNITYEMARKKLTRNILLAHEEYNPYNENDDNGIMYKYGYMQMIVKNRTVIWMKPSGKYPRGWMKDVDKYDELNKMLGIE
jgi:hypothetical protein